MEEKTEKIGGGRDKGNQTGGKKLKATAVGASVSIEKKKVKRTEKT